MNKERLIQKWLDHDLSAQELEAFKQLEDYDALTALDAHLKTFKADPFDTEETLDAIKAKIESRPKKSRRLVPLLSKIAAILVVCFGIYFLTRSSDTVASTMIAQHKSIVLPDASEVTLNALSTITYSDSSWDSERHILLDGEAFFKVSKGQSFEVETSFGTVTVLGTEFNVKQRDNYFEVICYEGKVGIETKSKQAILLPGDRFLIIDGNYIATEKESVSSPSWLDHNSTFKSIPYREVIAEFERQYNVSIALGAIDGSQLFTGSFTHNDIEIALKSITLPLQLKYSKTDNIIRLKRD